MIPEYIIIHHSLTEDSKTVSWGAIRRYHTETLGWKNVGYNFCVELIGDYYEILFGRMPYEVGAHTHHLGMNRRSLGVLITGNYDLIEPNVQILNTASKLVKWLMQLYNIPVENVIGHREVGEMAGYDWRKGEFKTCPGRKFSMNNFRNLLDAGH